MNSVVKNFRNKEFAGVLNYHKKYFEASAWFVLGINRFTTAKDTGVGMGEAAGTAQHAAELFESINSILANVPQDYHGNF